MSLLKACGAHRWLPWLASLAMDAPKVLLLVSPSSNASNSSNGESQAEAVEQDKRLADLLFYYLRQPFAQHWLEPLLFTTNEDGEAAPRFVASVPIVGRPMAELLRGYWRMAMQFYFCTSAS